MKIEIYHVILIYHFLCNMKTWTQNLSHLKQMYQIYPTRKIFVDENRFKEQILRKIVTETTT